MGVEWLYIHVYLADTLQTGQIGSLPKIDQIDHRLLHTSTSHHSQQSWLIYPNRESYICGYQQRMY